MMRTRGFTLLEVMVSLSILALALTAIAGINANSFESSNYARHVTVATLMARSKMLDIEEQLRKDGFGDSDKEFDGDFSDEGYPSMKWTAVSRKVEVDVSQLVGGLFGGDVATENLPDQVGAFLEGMKGLPAGEGGGKGGEGEVGGNELSQLLGGGGMELMFKQVGETLADSIREITLEITWGNKRDQESVKFVQYVTTTGRLAIPQGGAPTIPGIPGLPGQPGIGGRTPENLGARDPTKTPGDEETK